MPNEYGNDILTLEDEDGVEHTFEVLDEYDDGDKHYIALSPIYDKPEELLEDSGDLVIMQVIEEDGEEILETIDDDDELDAIADIFMKRLDDQYDFEDEDGAEEE